MQKIRVGSNYQRGGAWNIQAETQRVIYRDCEEKDMRTLLEEEWEDRWSSGIMLKSDIEETEEGGESPKKPG